jgi:hypothetical protein
MKPLIPCGFLLVLAVAVICGLALLNDKAQAAGSNSVPSLKRTSAALPPTDFQTLASRKLMSSRDMLNYLEQNGEVPEDADHVDWQLAQQTSWWGKRLDPKTFWSGRVVWSDISARMAARKHGRFYPPIPYEDAKVSNHSDKDESASSGSVEGQFVGYYSSDREGAFWDRLTKPTSRHLMKLSESNWL